MPWMLVDGVWFHHTAMRTAEPGPGEATAATIRWPGRRCLSAAESFDDVSIARPVSRPLTRRRRRPHSRVFRSSRARRPSAAHQQGAEARAGF
jgi:hypothetical protein